MSTQNKAGAASDADTGSAASPEAGDSARKPRKTAARKRTTAAKKRPAKKKTAPAPAQAQTADGGDGVGTAAPAADPAPAAPAATPTPADSPAETLLLNTPMTVRWRDLDAFNHVNNSKYLSYLEEARLRWMLGVPGQGLDDDVAPVVAAAHLNYKRPIEWPAEIAIELFVERLGNTSVSIGHRIAAAADRDTLYCDGYVVMVWIDRETGQAAPLPEAVREACSP